MRNAGGKPTTTSKRKRAKAFEQLPSERDQVKEVQFPHVEGKTVASVKFCGHGVDISLILDFTDGTALIIDCYPEARTTMSADYSDWTTGAPLRSKRWGSILQWGGI